MTEIMTKKSVLRLAVLLIMIIAGASQSYAIFDKYTLDREDLPENAREMLDTYFPKAKVGMIGGND